MNDDFNNLDDNDLFREEMHGTAPLKQRKSINRYTVKGTIKQPSKLQCTKTKQRTQASDYTPTTPEPNTITIPRYNEDYLETITSDQQLFYAKPGLQTRTIRKLRKGQLPIEAELDLHGLTVNEAHEKLKNFLNNCQKRRKRTLCIIHGKGMHANENRAALKSAVNNWLTQVDAVLAFCSAQPKDGGTGAIYLLLKSR